MPYINYCLKPNESSLNSGKAEHKKDKTDGQQMNHQQINKVLLIPLGLTGRLAHKQRHPTSLQNLPFWKIGTIVGLPW